MECLEGGSRDARICLPAGRWQGWLTEMSDMSR